MTIQEMLNNVYKMIQELQIQPTEHNVGIIAQSLQALREVYAGVNLLQAEIEKLRGGNEKQQVGEAEEEAGQIVELRHAGGQTEEAEADGPAEE